MTDPVGQSLTNKELSEAIVRTKSLIYGTAQNLRIFNMLTDHMGQLLSAEKARAKEDGK